MISFLIVASGFEHEQACDPAVEASSDQPDLASPGAIRSLLTVGVGAARLTAREAILGWLLLGVLRLARWGILALAGELDTVEATA